MSTTQEMYKAWADAEDQVAKYLAEKAGMKYGPGGSFGVGGREDLEGRYDLAMFQIEGGEAQGQGFQSGTLVWHTLGRVVGRWADRREAMRVGCLLVQRGVVPVDGGAATTLPNVVKVYARAHPTIASETVPLANSSRMVRLYRVEVEYGVVYCAVEET